MVTAIQKRERDLTMASIADSSTIDHPAGASPLEEAWQQRQRQQSPFSRQGRGDLDRGEPFEQ